MSGMINKTPASSSALANPVLQQMESGIEAKLTPANRADYMKIVVAGMKIALANGPNGFMARLRKMPDPIAACAKGAVALVLIMRKESKGVMPMQAGIPAGVSLMLHGLDFIDRSGIVKIGQNEAARATTIFTNQLFHRLGITPAMLHSATARVHQIVQSPDDMQKIQLKAGMLRHPDAALPSNIPGVPAAA